VVQDLRHAMDEAGASTSDITWNCEGLVAAAKTDDAGYTVELAIPLASIGGTAKPGTHFAGNICRERYAGRTRRQGPDLQSWTATQTGFNDSKYFSRIVLVDRDGSSRFFNATAPAPKPVLYKVDGKNPWTLSRESIRAVADQDRVRYEMKCPRVADKGRTYGGFGIKLDPPVDVSRYPYAEIVFRKPSPDLMLEMIYRYTDKDGAEHTNYFVFSPWGDGSKAHQVFTGRLARGHQRDKPAPHLLKGVTVYGVVSGVKTPIACDFTVEWIRICRYPLEGDQP